MKYTDISLKAGRDSSLRRFHPWIFSGALEEGSIAGLPNGAPVRVFTKEGVFRAVGFFSQSSIAVKVLSREDEAITEQFFATKISEAVAMRAAAGLTMSNPKLDAFRLIHGEGDGLPGLIVDRFGPVLSIEFHSEGMIQCSAMLVEALRSVLGDSINAIVGGSNAIHAADSRQVLWQRNPEVAIAPFLISQYDLSFQIDPVGGQKTGFFTDQRENRRAIAKYAQGRTVLDCFCYSGGFGSAALVGGAKQVTFVDSSEPALALAQQNAARNNPGSVPVTFEKADCLEFLKRLPQPYDLIVLDPPAFVKHRGALSGGMKGYESINYNAIRQIEAGGILATFSCSQLVSRDDFRTAVFKGAVRAARKVRVLEELSQPLCHPVSLFHPEGAYLKGLILEVR